MFRPRFNRIRETQRAEATRQRSKIILDWIAEKIFEEILHSPESNVCEWLIKKAFEELPDGEEPGTFVRILDGKFAESDEPSCVEARKKIQESYRERFGELY